jgi:uncharacterized membrane protein
MKAGSAAKLIVDALLQRFLPLARRRIETAQAQVSYYLLSSSSSSSYIIIIIIVAITILNFFY